MSFTEQDILKQLDLAHKGIASEYYPQGNDKDIKYNFFLDLEHGYCETAGNRIHLYADSTRWAIVFEKNGYQNRASSAEIELDYIGNCINYNIDSYPERSYITNAQRITLISYEDYEKISSEDCFELILKDSNEINIRNVNVKIEQDINKYISLGINIRDYDNPENLISYSNLIRYLNETNPEIINATEEDIKKHIPLDLPKLMTINEFHFVSFYDQDTPPSKQETFDLISKILVSKDISLWKPTLESNNHWSNWESGHL